MLCARVSTPTDATWSANRLLSLAAGALIVEAIGVRALFWSGETLLAFAGLLGLVFLGGYDFRRMTSA